MLALVLALTSPSAHAQTVSFDIDDKAAKSVGLSADAVQAEIDSAFDDDLQLFDLDSYLDEMASAASFASRGMGVDYVNHPKAVLVGVGVGAATSGLNPGELIRGSDDVVPPEGYAAQFTVMGGVNVGMLSGSKFLKRLVVFGNFMYANAPSNQPIRGQIRNLGLHAQLRVLGPANLAVLRWEGLSVTAGFAQASYRLNLRQELPLAGQVQGVDLEWRGQGDYLLRSRSVTVPLELSSAITVLDIASVFGGVAFDGVTAAATAEAELSGDIVATADGNETRIGEASVALSSDGDAGPASQRIFVGVAAKVPVLGLGIYGQVNFDGREQFGAHTGLRWMIGGRDKKPKK